MRMVQSNEKSVFELMSAQLDGEEEAASGWLAQPPHDGELSARWNCYHMIGDVLRGTSAHGVDMVRLRAALAAEPTVLVRRRHTGAAARLGWRTGMSAAAGSVAVALGVWLVWPAAVQPPAEPAVVAASAPRPPIAQAGGVQDYLLAHQAFSPSFAMQGAAPYVRMVADTSRGSPRP